MIYEGFFKFADRPFLAAAQVNRYFPAPAIENARQTLVRAVERGEGAGLLVGAPGTGKSMLCQMIAHEFEDRFIVSLLSSGRLATRQALLQAILYTAGQPYRGMDEGELRLALVDFLEPSTNNKDGLLLIVDEAHTLPLRLLEEIRMITNLVRDGQPRVRVVLSGSPTLEERFASPKLASFSQRLAARCYLEPLDSPTTAAYVRSQITAVGGNPAEIVDDETLRAVYRASDGIPRLINQVCDHALILAHLGGIRKLTSAAIDEAWADLQQLPSPWSSGEPRTAASDNVIEFGALDDVGDDAPAAIPFRAAAASERLHLATEETDGVDEIQVGDFALDSDDEERSEVELEFPEFRDTFNEHFAEEEVVLDRYAADVEVFAEVPRVTSWEGRQLGAMLDPIRHAPAASFSPRFGTVPAGDEPPIVSLPPLVAYAGPELVCPPPAEFELAEANSAPWPDSLDQLPTPEHSQSTVEPLAPAAESAPDNRAATFWAGAKATDEQAELIIVEDGPPSLVQPSRRRREYRQLFAKLRRG